MSSSSAYTTEFRNNRPRLLVCKKGDIYDASHAIVLSILIIAGTSGLWLGILDLIWCVVTESEIGGHN